MPLFEILGWNIRSYRDMETECNCGYDEEIYKNLQSFPNYTLPEKYYDRAYIVDFVFKINDTQYFFLETKGFGINLQDLQNYASLQHPAGFRIF